MRFYYFDGQTIRDPLEVSELVQQAGFGPESLVCPVGSQNTGDWKAAVNYEALRRALLDAPPKASGPEARCPLCGHDNPGDAVFCNHCGARLQGGPDIPLTEPWMPPPPEAPPAARPEGRGHGGGMGRIGDAMPDLPAPAAAGALPASAADARPDQADLARSKKRRVWLSALVVGCLVLAALAAVHLKRKKPSRRPAARRAAAKSLVAPAPGDPLRPSAAAPGTAGVGISPAAATAAGLPASQAEPATRPLGLPPQAAPLPPPSRRAKPRIKPKPAATDPGEASQPSPRPRPKFGRKASAAPRPANTLPEGGRDARPPASAAPPSEDPQEQKALELPGIPKKVKRAPAAEPGASSVSPDADRILMESAKDQFTYCQQLLKGRSFETAFRNCLCPARRDGPHFKGKLKRFVKEAERGPEVGSAFQVLSTQVQEQSVIITARWSPTAKEPVERAEKWSFEEGRWCQAGQFFFAPVDEPGS
ncbi:MAG: hypothetical protein HY927_07605 [Elusimicrobia bacterium]|nr:hypothetical protein [Elusimicrobiota bacterium]